MKFASTTALALALAFGATAMVATQPAMAQKKEKAAKGPSFDLSKGVREAVAAAQKALEANDTATATAKLGEAKGLAQNQDDKYVISSVSYDLGRKTNDLNVQMEGIDGMLSSGKVAAEQQGMFYTALGQLAYQQKQYPKAEQALTQAVAIKPDGNTYAVLVEAKNANGKPADAVETLEKAIAAQTAAGTPVPNDWYGRGLSIALGAKNVPAADQARLAAAAGRLTQGLVAAYPTKSNWRDALIIYRDLNKIDADQELDLNRLMRAAGVLNGERDYMDYVQATYLKFPAEAKAVLEEGSKAGYVNLSGGSGKEIYDIVKGKIAADKASLSKSASTGRSALATGDAYLGYGEWANAIEMYRMALTKGGVDAGTVNLRLAMALAQAGQKDEAKQALAGITGPRAGLAKYMTIWLDHPVTA